MLTEPAVGKSFFGRDDVLHVLKKRANALKGGYRQNVALTGQMLSGKSSILYQFLYTLRDASLIPIYIEVVEEHFSSFADKFIATLLYNCLLSLGHGAKKDLHELIKLSEGLIPHTVSGIKKVRQEVARKNYNDAYKKLLNLTSILKEETGKSCVVILDEFHNLEFLKVKKAYLHFGKIIMIQKDTMYIVSSSQKNTIKKILAEKLDLLYGNFEVVEVSGFDNKTAKAFLSEKLQNVILPGVYADYLIDFTDGNPFYLDVISKKLLEIANFRKLVSIDEDALIEALASLVHNTNGTVNQYFTNNIMSLLEKDLRTDYLDLLIAIAAGCNKTGDMARWCGKKSPRGLSDKIGRLIELGMVYRNGIFYEVHDKVFKFWLKAVYHKKKSVLIDDVVNRMNDFKKVVAADVDEYASESKKSVQERIVELFSFWGGELVEIEKKTRRLPRFARIDVQTYGRSEGILGYQKPDRYWVCEIMKDKIEETDVSDFIERRYPGRDKIGRKIVIALDGIERNALLLAKEKNIWVWDLTSINSLLRLYKKHNLNIQ